MHNDFFFQKANERRPMGQITGLRNNVQYYACFIFRKTSYIVLRPLTKAAGLLPSLLSPAKKFG